MSCARRALVPRGVCVFGWYNMQIVRHPKKKLLPINRRARLYTRVYAPERDIALSSRQ